MDDDVEKMLQAIPKVYSTTSVSFNSIDAVKSYLIYTIFRSFKRRRSEAAATLTSVTAKPKNMDASICCCSSPTSTTACPIHLEAAPATASTEEKNPV